MRLLMLALTFASLPSLAEVSNYKLDAGHTSVIFKVNHMGYSNVYGMFRAIDGKFTFDEAKPEKSSFEVTIKADSVDTNEKKRDDHLRNQDFFNVKQYPTITLKSKSVKKSGEKFDITADLNLHGVTKPVTFTFNRMKTAKDPWGNMRTGGEAVLKIKRTDFGMNYMAKPGEVGDEVELIINVEGVKQ